MVFSRGSFFKDWTIWYNTDGQVYSGWIWNWCIRIRIHEFRWCFSWIFQWFLSRCRQTSWFHLGSSWSCHVCITIFCLLISGWSSVFHKNQGSFPIWCSETARISCNPRSNPLFPLLSSWNLGNVCSRYSARLRNLIFTYYC